jgi:hypothetical protein
MNALVKYFQGFQTILSESTKGLTLNPQESLKSNHGKAQEEEVCLLDSLKSPHQLNKPSIGCDSLFENINIDEIVNFLRNNGFSLGINLPPCVVKEILEFAKYTPYYANGNTSLGFYHADKEQAQMKHGKPFFFGNYYNTALLCSAIRKLETDPTLLEIARQYLQAEPIHQGNQLWWNFPVDSTISERQRASQMFYYGSNNYRLLKFVFYITDVDLCSSPHVCVQRSHVNKKFSYRFLGRGDSYQELIKYYGYKNLVPICGKAGSGFVEDTRCFHTETPPGSKERLTLQIEFALKDYSRPNDIREASQLKCIL